MFATDIAEDRQRITALEEVLLGVYQTAQKVPELEQKIETLTKLLNSDFNKTTKKAMLLKDFVENRGILSRRDVQKILNNCHHNTAHKVMKKTSELYGYIHTKNISGKWVLLAK
jgi:hypothetical protein